MKESDTQDFGVLLKCRESVGLPHFLFQDLGLGTDDELQSIILENENCPAG